MIYLSIYLSISSSIYLYIYLFLSIYHFLFLTISCSLLEYLLSLSYTLIFSCLSFYHHSEVSFYPPVGLVIYLLEYLLSLSYTLIFSFLSFYHLRCVFLSTLSLLYSYIFISILLPSVGLVIYLLEYLLSLSYTLIFSFLSFYHLRCLSIHPLVL